MSNRVLWLAIFLTIILKGFAMNELIPLKNKGSSLMWTVNFLFEEKNIYFSDNHRTALWCWMQHLKHSESVAVFHIDRHFDTINLSPEYVNNFPGSFNLGSITNYLNLTVKLGNESYPLITWDNYLSFFISDKTTQNNINCIYLATHGDGDYPENPYNHSIQESSYQKLIINMMSAFDNHEKTIVNIDLDYFFIDDPQTPGKYIKSLDDCYIENLFKTVKNGLDRNKILCLTICLSPECCGGWQEAEHALDIAKKELGINFTL